MGGGGGWWQFEDVRGRADGAGVTCKGVHADICTVFSEPNFNPNLNPCLSNPAPCSSALKCAQVRSSASASVAYLILESSVSNRCSTFLLPTPFPSSLFPTSSTSMLMVSVGAWWYEVVV